MKRLLLALVLAPILAPAMTTIDTANAHAYGANIGWINARGDGANGAVIGEYFCSGFLYSANCGWIHLGDGTPVNGFSYQNNSAADFGVNTEQYAANGSTFEARLRGYAYGANIGWVRFEDLGNPRVNLATGQLLGFAWGANVGWIALSGSGVTVTTTSIAPGPDTDSDTIPDAWERFQAGNLTTLGSTTDRDGDGVLDKDEYAADTDPLDSLDLLQITALVRPRNVAGTGSFATDVTWTSKPTRWYEIEANIDLLSPWLTVADSLAPDGASTFERFNDPLLAALPGKRFYRVRAKLPLAP